MAGEQLLTSWLPVHEESHFSLQNLPYGVYSTSENPIPRIGVAIGEYVLDMKVLSQEGVFSALDFDISSLQQETLNAFASLGRGILCEVRRLLQDFLREDTVLGRCFRDRRTEKDRVLAPLSKVNMHMPMHIGDYTDFFVGPYHAKNCSEIVRPGTSLNSNFFSQPLAYHGRSSSIVISETSFRRPRGQFLEDDKPVLRPTKKLDFEVEFAAFIARGSEMGESVDVNNAEDHIFGFVLMNDWSARDIQAREMMPLGPFNGKNFCTTISPWIVTLDALEPFRTLPLHSGPWLPYLNQQQKDAVYDIPVQVSLADTTGRYSLSRCNTKFVAFSFPQMLAHHTIGGCRMQTGDLIATGTLSGPTHGELGCLLEMTRSGSVELEFPSSSMGDGDKVKRTFLEDGDTVEFSALAAKRSGVGNVGFGVCSGRVTPAR